MYLSVRGTSLCVISRGSLKCYRRDEPSLQRLLPFGSRIEQSTSQASIRVRYSNSGIPGQSELRTPQYLKHIELPRLVASYSTQWWTEKDQD